MKARIQLLTRSDRQPAGLLSLDEGVLTASEGSADVADLVGRWEKCRAELGKLEGALGEVGKKYRFLVEASDGLTAREKEEVVPIQLLRDAFSGSRQTFPPEDEGRGWKGGIKGSLFSLTTPAGVKVGVLSLWIHPNYEGLLEGTPGPDINPQFRQRHVERARRHGGTVLEVPPRYVPLGRPWESGTDSRERLPRYACSAHLALPAKDPDALWADLTIAWWQESLDRPMADVIGEALDQVDWKGHAVEIPFL